MLGIVTASVNPVTSTHAPPVPGSAGVTATACMSGSYDASTAVAQSLRPEEIWRIWMPIQSGRPRGSPGLPILPGTGVCGRAPHRDHRRPGGQVGRWAVVGVAVPQVEGVVAGLDASR